MGELDTQFEHFHAGEVAVHADWGIDTDGYEQASKQMMLPEMNPEERLFISALTFSFAGTVDDSGRPWASPLFAVDSQSLFDITSPTGMTIRTGLGNGDPLLSNIEANNELSVVFFETSTRRRAKSIGTGIVGEAGEISYEMKRIFGICPKYIFKREHTPSIEASGHRPEARVELDAADRVQLRHADTIFFASHSPHGADVTHRGGPPGFIRILDARTLEIPDYLGNGMFNTLGNLRLDDRLAITTVDFENGRTIQMTGRATEESTGLALPEPERMVVFHIDDVLVSWAPVGHWDHIEPSRYTPSP